MVPTNDRHRSEAVDQEMHQRRASVAVELRIRLFLELGPVDSRSKLINDDHPQASKGTFHSTAITIPDTKLPCARIQVQYEAPARPFEASDGVVGGNRHALQCEAP
jgi:hypothetical protein